MKNGSRLNQRNDASMPQDKKLVQNRISVCSRNATTPQRFSPKSGLSKRMIGHKRVMSVCLPASQTVKRAWSSEKGRHKKRPADGSQRFKNAFVAFAVHSCFPIRDRRLSIHLLRHLDFLKHHAENRNTILAMRLHWMKWMDAFLRGISTASEHVNVFIQWKCVFIISCTNTNKSGDLLAQNGS